MPSLQSVISCLSDYDPTALPVAQANAIIGQVIEPVRGTEQLAIRTALDRVLAEDVISPIDVPAHDNSAMDGYAFQSAALAAGGCRRGARHRPQNGSGCRLPARPRIPAAPRCRSRRA